MWQKVKAKTPKCDISFDTAYHMLAGALQVDNGSNEIYAKYRREVDEHEKELEADTIPKLPIDKERIHRIIQDLPTGKAIGYSGIPNECFKYGLCENLITVVSFILDRAINHAELPSNLSVVKPIPKNSAKDLNDINNYRPISISDPVANIFEHYLAEQSQGTKACSRRRIFPASKFRGSKSPNRN